MDDSIRSYSNILPGRSYIYVKSSIKTKTVLDITADYFALLKSECARNREIVLTWEYVKRAFQHRFNSLLNIVFFCEKI